MILVDHVVVFSDSFSQAAILFLFLLDIEVVCFQEMLALKVQKLERNKLKSAIVCTSREAIVYFNQHLMWSRECEQIKTKEAMLAVIANATAKFLT